MPWVMKEPRYKQPRDGWVSEYMGMEVVGNSLDELVFKLKRMMKANGVKDELLESSAMGHICSRLSVSDPWMVRYMPDDKIDSRGISELSSDIEENGPDGRALNSVEKGCEEWLVKMKEIVGKEKDAIVYEANVRVGVCRKCPNLVNSPDHVDQVKPELRERYRQLAMLTSQGKVREFEDAGCCSVFRHDNRVAAFKGNPFASKVCCGRDQRGIPDDCWLFSE